MKRAERQRTRNLGVAYATDAQRWQALTARDKNADAHFYYSVKSTGVYCRPACPSRIPRKENVAFYRSCEAAEMAGFRPCKRCQPGGMTLAQEHAAAIARACSLMQTSENEPSLTDMSRAVGMSPFHFHRVFKKLTGLTPKAFAGACRADALRHGMLKSKSVTQAIYNAGFNSSGRFYSKSSELLGMKATSFRNGGDGTTIRFAVGESALGAVLVASSEKGVCWISLGNDPGKLLRELQDAFPKAHLTGGDRGYERLVSSVVGIVESGHLSNDLPLDLRGTSFQQRVWKQLQEIPVGETRTYSQLARSIGHPGAVRAVARACAANKVAVVVPCHRIVRMDGSISGYRWGVKRKIRLLKRESAPLQKSKD